MESITLPDLKENEEAIRQQIKDELFELGILECPPEIIDRLVLLEQNSKFNNDSRMVQEGFVSVLNAIESLPDTQNHLTDVQKKEGELAAYLHDIGKSGGAEADSNGQLAVIRLFAIENFKSPNQSISKTVGEYFSNEQEKVLDDLKQSGMEGEMTMQNLYDNHAQWTHDILEKFPGFFSGRSRLIAASHHMDKHINPYGIPEDEVPIESSTIGALENYIDSLEEKVLMAVDKYQAVVSRRGLSGASAHQKAVEFLKDKFEEEGYANDQTINLIIKTIDELGQKEILFPKTQGRYLSLRAAA